MFKFHIKKCYIRRTCSNETKQNFSKYCQVVLKFLSVRLDQNQGLSAQHPTTLPSKLQLHLSCPREIWIIYRKKKFPETSKFRRNSANPKKTEIFVFRISKKIDLIILPNRSNRSNRRKSKLIRSIYWSKDEYFWISSLPLSDNRA